MKIIDIENGEAYTRSKWVPYLKDNLKDGITSGDADCAGWSAEGLATLNKFPSHKYFKFDNQGDGVWPVVVNPKQIVAKIKKVVSDTDDKTGALNEWLSKCVAGSIDALISDTLMTYIDNHGLTNDPSTETIIKISKQALDSLPSNK